MAQTQIALLAPPPPGLQEATKNSTLAWQEDLEALFRHAKDRFPDVVWELVGAEDDPNQAVEEVWGHKAIVYARAPPSFQNRYFSFRANAVGHGPSPAPQESALSLGLESSSLDLGLVIPRTPSPSRPISPSTLAHSQHHGQGQGPSSSMLLRLTTSINPSLFSDELEYLYTGKGFGEAFEFLFDSSDTRERTLGHTLANGESGDGDGYGYGAAGGSSKNGTGNANANGTDADADAESLRIDKLRKDLVFMWRSRLYSDVRIALTGNFGGAHESTTAIFSSHRFILVSRSPYFHTALIGWPGGKSSSSSSTSNGGGNGNGDPPTLTLPSPPFTPASLHFTLGFIYTGTLIFSHRSYDLSTAFAILRAALYLSLATLHDEVQARVVQEMLHGLFHAFLPFAEYELLTKGRWGTGGCRCRQCARRAPRVLAFALADDVKNTALERGARRALVGLFGEGWCTPEFAALAPKLRESLVRGVSKRTAPLNVLPLLFAAEHALARVGAVIDPWADVVREAVGAVRRGVEEVLCGECESCFESEAWMEIMEGEGVRFEDGERVEWAMAAVLRGVGAREACAAKVYQTLVSSIILRPHPTDTTAAFLPVTSHIRVQVESTRVELLKWIGKRWLGIRHERGFDELEGWALKEISDSIEVPIDDLLSPPSYSSQKALSNPSSSKRNSANMLLRPTSNHPHTSKVDAESDAGSSMRVSVLSRSLAGAAGAGGRTQGTATGTSTSMSMSGRSQHSVRSDARSTHTLSSLASNSTISAARHGQSASSHSNVNSGNGEDSPARRLVKEVRAGRTRERDRRPDSKLTPSSPRTGGGSRTPSPVRRMQPSIVEPNLEEELEGEDEYANQDDVESRDGEYDEDDVSLRQPSELGEADEEGDEEEEQGDESVLQDEDDEKSLASDVPSVYHTPRPLPASSSHAKGSAAGAGPVIQKTLITRASLASVTSRSSAAPGVRTRTSSSASAAGPGPKPRSLAPSIKSQTTHARKTVLSTSSSSIRTSQYSSAVSGAGSSRPNSRGSTYSTTPRTGRLTTTTTTKATPSPTSRPVSRVSTVSTARSISGGNRPTSTASTATDTGSASTYRTAPGPTLTTPLAQRQRKTSATSTTSVRTAGGRSAAGSPVRDRARRISGASVNSVASNASSVTGAGGAGRTRATPVKRTTTGGGVTAQDPTKLSPVVPSTRAGRIQASTSGGSVKSSVSSSSTSTQTKKSPTTTTSAPVASPAGVRARTLSNKKSMESMKKHVEGGSKAQQQVAEKVVVPPVPSVPGPQAQAQAQAQAQVQPQTPPSPSSSIPPELPSKDVEVKVDVNAENENENVAVPLLTPSKVQEKPQEPAPPAPAPPVPTSETTADTSISSDEFSPANTTTSTMTVRQKVYPDFNNNEHKKTSSSASSSSVATLRRKGSTDTIRTVKSSGLSVTSDGGGSAGSKAGAGSSRPSSHPQQQVQVPPQPTSQVVQHQQPNVMTSPPLPPLPLLSSPVLTNKSPLMQQPSSIDFLLASDTPTGSTLEIGIPCIISSKRKRFKAYARYIGEVAGEYGPWVGVEVPMPVGGDDDQRGDDRQWNDGSWGGIRYFEIGGVMGGGSEWDYGAGGGEDRAARRRRIDGGSVGGAVWGGSGFGYGRDKGGLKREGDQLSISSDRMKRMRSVSPAVSDMSGTETRGLFVRPQQVLYVVDAVGADL